MTTAEIRAYPFSESDQLAVDPLFAVLRKEEPLVDTMVAGGTPAELVEGFALPLPITVICELLGVPVEDRSEFRVWSDAFLSTTKFTPDEVMANVGQLREYMAGLIADRRRAARDDLISALVVARDQDDRLSEDELLSLAEGILVAGHETTASQIPNFVYVLLHNPTHLAALQDNPDLVPKAVEELMRWVPLGVGGSTARYATEDVALGGVTVRTGEPVVVALNSANRDESVFTEPDTIDFARADSPPRPTPGLRRGVEVRPGHEGARAPTGRLGLSALT